MRKIIHIDMDAFFASIEQRDRPGLRGLPVIVGGSAERRGVVSTCSYEARAFGVHSAMPMRTAQRLCPQAVYLEVDMKKYRNESARIREIFYSVTDLVEPVSIDEAYLDVTENKRSESSATRLARAVQREIFLKTGLTASAGVSYNKFLAKIASDLKKPAGLTVIPPERAMEFLDSLPVGKFHGIGKVSAAKLTGMNIRTGRDLRQLDAATLSALFGKTGLFYYNIVRGIDNRPVEVEDEPKSIGRGLHRRAGAPDHAAAAGAARRPPPAGAESGRENRHDQGEIREFRDGDPFAFAACSGLRRGGDRRNRGRARGENRTGQPPGPAARRHGR